MNHTPDHTFDTTANTANETTDFQETKEEQDVSLALYGAFRRTGNHMHRIAHASFPQVDMHPAQARLLHILTRHDGATQRELADVMAIRPPSLTPLIQKLEEQGLAQRTPNPQDRRSLNVFLTSKGKEQAKALDSMRNQHANDAFSVLTLQEQRELLRLLTTLENEWERLGETGKDYLPYFLQAVHTLPQDVLLQALVDEGIAAAQAKTLIIELKESVSKMNETMNPYENQNNFDETQRQSPPTDRRNHCPKEGRAHRRDGNGPHRETYDKDTPFEKSTSQQGPYGSHGPHGSHQPGGHGPHGRRKGQGGRQHYGRAHAKGQGRGHGHGRGYACESHRMRRDFVRAGYDVEGVRRALEELGLDVNALRRLVETLDAQDA